MQLTNYMIAEVCRRVETASPSPNRAPSEKGIRSTHEDSSKVTQKVDFSALAPTSSENLSLQGTKPASRKYSSCEGAQTK